MLYNNRPQIKIGKRWSYDTWGLLLASGWSLASAEPKTAFVEVPAADGAIDISEVLSGEPRYNNRALNFGLIFTQPEREWEQLRQNVENYCHGQRMEITLPHDTRHYLKGRVRVENLEREGPVARLNIAVDCDPWRYKNKETFFEVKVPAVGSITGILRNQRRRVLPKITADGSVDVTINGITQSMSAGTFKFTDFILHPGNNPVTVAGAEGTTVTFTYQEASL